MISVNAGYPLPFISRRLFIPPNDMAILLPYVSFRSSFVLSGPRAFCRPHQPSTSSDDRGEKIRCPTLCNVVAQHIGPHWHYCDLPRLHRQYSNGCWRCLEIWGRFEPLDVNFPPKMAIFCGVAESQYHTYMAPRHPPTPKTDYITIKY